MSVLDPPRIAVPGLAARAVANEAAKGLQLLWRRRAMVPISTVALGVTYLMFQYFIGGGHLNRAVVALTLPALAAYAVAGGAALQGSGGIAEEANGGTLEQSSLSPVPATVLVLGRLAALAVEGLIPAVVLTAAFWPGLGIRYAVRPDVLVPLVLTIVDALGYALLVTALTVTVASVGAVVHVFNMAIMFFGGLLVPVSVFPHGLQVAVRLVPTAAGVEVLDTTLAGRGLSAAWADGTLGWLLVHAVVLAGLSWAAYVATVRRARQRGGLAR